MLKDLDQRKNDQSTSIHNGNNTDVNFQKSNKKIIFIIVLVVLAINVVGLYMWQLHQENQSLKTSAEQQSNVSNVKTQLTLASQLSSNNIETNSVNTLNATNNKKEVLIKKITAPQLTTTNIEKTKSIEIVKRSEIIETEQVNKVSTGVRTTEKDKSIKQAYQAQTLAKVNTTNNKTNIQTKNTRVTPIQKSTRNENVEGISEKSDKESSLKISRSQLSPKRLAQQKVERAERAINNNEIQKAEKLFEEVLLILPEHKSARKQLGALWFGRQLYRPAVNLLSRGISLHPKDIDFRIMKAKILLSQNNNQEAFNVLNGFSTAKHVEYQALLANISQLLKRNENTIVAYKQLVDLENHKGKWWLGLAVALDRNSQFLEAKSAYKNALIKDDLSDSSDDFIRQRLSELGE